MNTFLPAACI